MNPNRLFAAVAFVALAGFAWQTAQAQPQVNGQRRVTSDGQGNGTAVGAGRFEAANGAQGQRSGRVKRNADGSVDAHAQGSLTTANGGTAARDAQFTRNADGSASASRNTSATNARTGVSVDGSTTWTKGQGLSRSATCTDAAGNTVTCGAAR
jgi:hypothetical protein